jgi:transposase
MTTDEELEALRQANRDLHKQVASLTQALTTATETINTLQEQVKLLQEQQGKDSHNSSLPPSSDRFVRRPKSLRKKSGKKAGGQAGHQGHHLRQVTTPDEIVRHRVERCEHCACDLSGQQAHVPERRQVFDLPSKRLWVVEHQAEEKGCPQCFKRTRAPFPDAVRAPAQYGAGMAALSVYLLHGQCVPYARAAEFLRVMLGVQLSAGSIARFLTQSHQPLQAVETALKAALIQAPVLHQDAHRAARLGKDAVCACGLDEQAHPLWSPSSSWSFCDGGHRHQPGFPWHFDA